MNSTVIFFFKDEKTGTASTKLKVMIHWPEGQADGSLGENNHFRENIHLKKIRDKQLGKVLCKNESEVLFIWHPWKDR